MEAPIRIIKIMLVVIALSRQMDFSKGHESLFLDMAIKEAPIAPRPAASVGVAMPKRIDPKTTTIRERGGHIAGQSLCLTLSVEVLGELARVPGVGLVDEVGWLLI